MSKRKALLCSLLLLFQVLAVRVLAQQGSETPSADALSSRIANYMMEVRLDTDEKTIDGAATLTWRNTTSHPTNELQFHLYYNAWRNDQSSFLQSVRYREFNLSGYKDSDWAYCDVRSMKILSEHGWIEADLTSNLDFIQPDDGNEHDRTVLRATLPRPIQPGETISLQYQWQSKIPRTFARTGVIDDYYFLAQWFPKVGVFEADGTWNCHQFIQTEFYADFGNYDVKLTVPTGWIVGATGREVEQKDNGDGTVTHRFVQEDVHDFAWTTSPHFQVHTARFEEPNLPPVEMRLLLMPDHADKKARYFAATRAALKYYGAWFGAYPYRHVTVVDPAYQSGSGGMEYPTFFTGGTRWLSPAEMRSPESVTVHECGHQFWYGIIANNEFEHAWLDEGFNTYSTTRTLEAAYPPPVLTRRYFDGFIPWIFPSVQVAERTAGADAFDSFRSDLKLDPMGTLSWQYGPDSYGLNSYGKPALILRTLEGYLGWETFQKVTSTYFDRWKFRHPTPQDYFAVLNDVSGEEMSWFIDQVCHTSNIFDYAVDEVYSERVRVPKGYVEKDGELVWQTREDEKEDEEGTNGDGAIPYRSSVFIRRWGEGIFPIEVRITFKNGEQVLEHWDGKARWTRFNYLKPTKVEKVEVDPEHKLRLDVNYSNNSWMRKPPAKIAAWKWTSKWIIWVQNVLEYFAFWG
jgi:hypothetical protein